MEAVPKQIEIYQAANGGEPFTDWLEGLRDKQTRARIKKYIDRLEDGNTSNVKPVGEGVHELVMDFGKGYRAYFGSDGPTLVVLLVGGDKSQQQSDIATAKEYWSDYNA